MYPRARSLTKPHLLSSLQSRLGRSIFANIAAFIDFSNCRFISCYTFPFRQQRAQAGCCGTSKNVVLNAVSYVYVYLPEARRNSFCPPVRLAFSGVLYLCDNWLRFKAGTDHVRICTVADDFECRFLYKLMIREEAMYWVYHYARFCRPILLYMYTYCGINVVSCVRLRM